MPVPDACRTTAAAPLRVFVVDDHTLFRRGLIALLAQYPSVRVVGEVGDAAEALRLAQDAKARGLSIMVGCMLGTSLAMAPAMLLSGYADFVDLDGPLLLARDREPGLRFEGSLVHPPEPALWG